MRFFGLELSLKRLREMRHPRQGALSQLLLPGTKIDYAREVGDGLRSSVVVAPLLWVARNFPEAPVQVERRRGREFEAQPEHPMALLLARPNPYYSGHVLWMATLLSYNADGNAYWAKVRDSRGAVRELWYVPHWMIEPKLLPGSTAFVDYYEYCPGGQALRLDPADVVHFRFGLDPDNPRRGLSPLRSVLREVYTDDEAAAFTASLLRNLGVPGLVVSPAQPNSVTPQQMAETKADLKGRFRGDARGEPLVFSGPTNIEQFGFSPQQLDLKTLRRIPEERVTAVLGIAAVVAGLGAGLDRSTFANYAEAREAAYESNIIPTQRAMSADLEVQLLPDFEARPAGWRVVFDNSRVRILQEDENRAAQRYALLYKGGLIKRSEGRRRMGFEVTPEDEVYFSPQPQPVQPPPATLPKRKSAPLWDVARLDAEWKAYDEELVRWEARILRRVRAAFQTEQAFVLAQLEDVLGNAVLVLPPDRWAELLESAYETVASEMGTRVARRFLSLEPPEGFRRRAVEWAGSNSLTRARGITETTTEALRAMIAEGVAGGDSVDQIARLIRQQYAAWAGEGDTPMGSSRAMTIARTEAGAAANWGAYHGGLESARAAGLSVEKGWLATRDDRTRDSHRARDGEWVGPEEKFSNGLLHPHDLAGPASEVVRCRCTLIWREVEG